MNRNIRIGKVSSVDYKTGMIQVTYPDLDDSVTDDLPYLTFNCEYEPPTVGSDVLVFHLSNGQAAAIAAGTYWNADNTPPEAGKNVYRKDFLANAIGEAYMQYKDKNLTIYADEITLKIKGKSTTVSEIISHIRSH